MASFYSSLTCQRDNMPALYLKEQQYMHSNPYYSSSSAYSDMLAGITDSQHDCIDLPSSATVILQGSSMAEPGSVASSNVHPSYNSVKDGRNEMFLPMVGGSMSGTVDFMNTIPNSKYLKAAQQLLDEVVNTYKTVTQKANKSQSLNTSGTTSGKDNDGSSKVDGMPLKTQEATAHSSRALSPSERQDLKNKLTELLAMMDEVYKRYKLYRHQMQIVASSFDAIAGCGDTKPYTTLTFQTISRQFRNLRDAINGQIQCTRASLGEPDNSSSKGGVITRLRYIDQLPRQQSMSQQLGMFQQQAWRPQRGLPETSVSVLRAWLFEHFLHPYPADAEKLMLARQTGLTRGQISNWFINARVRLWKPMVEDIYKEEMGDMELDSKEREALQSSIAQGHDMNQFNESPKSSYISNTGNGVSLTLGLQHCNGDPPRNPAEVADYDWVNLADQRLRFGPPHLINDFVA